MSVAGAMPDIEQLSPPAPEPPWLSLLVSVDRMDAGAERSLTDIVRAVGAGVEVIACTREPWDGAPDGVTVVSSDAASRGDRLDAGAITARADLLAFVDTRVRMPARWAPCVKELFGDATLVVAGGPVLPRSPRRSERVTTLLLNRLLGVTPLGHVSRMERGRVVEELAGSNLVVRRDAFWAVGGFQSPSDGGEAARICYKVRSIVGAAIRYEPALAVSATAPAFPRSFLRQVSMYGRVRGDLSRRTPDIAPLVPYGLPFVGLLFLLAEVAVIALRHWHLAFVGAVMLAYSFAVQAVSVLTGKGRWGDRLLAVAAIPAIPVVYGWAFLLGFLGPNRGEVSPGRTSGRSLRVLIIDWRDVAHPYSGGAETYMHEIGRRWAAQGVEVGWLCQRARGRPRVETIDGIRVHRVGGRFTVYAAAPLAYLTRLRRRYDAVIDCENGIPFFTPLYSRLPRVLVVHHVHTEFFQRHTRPPVRWLGLWLESWVMPRVYRRSAVIAVSASTRDDLGSLGFDATRISVVHNGVHQPRQVERRASARPSILYTGRLVTQKRVDVLIRALPAVLTAFPDARLEVVGQGPERQRLERLAWSLKLAGHVRFHGYLSDRRRDELVAAAWVAVCPSLLEGWGITCMEASARGVPVVASDVKGLRDAVVDSVTGVLVPPSDPSVLAVALTLLLADPQRRERMGAAGRRWAQEHSWEATAAGLRLVLDGAMSGRDAEPSAITEGHRRAVLELEETLVAADAG